VFYIDVRDVALAHVRAAFAPKSAGNQRYLIAGPGHGTTKMVTFLSLLKSNFKAPRIPYQKLSR
jgi:hypothetical protein